MKNLIAIIKNSEICNLGCKYCYFFNGLYQPPKSHPAIIQPATIESIASFLYEAIASLQLQHILLCFHGGEPLLQDKKSFDSMCTYFKKILASSIDLDISIQTNGTIIDAGWIDLFSKHNVSVGVSLDGPKEYHDISRVDHRGKGSYDRISKGIALLQAAVEQKRIREIGVLCVIDPSRNAKIIYRHFVDDLKIKRMDFILPDFHWDNPEKFDDFASKKYGDFLIQIFEEWVGDENSQITVRILQAMIRNLGGKPTSLLGLGPNPKTTEVITIASNGDLSPEESLSQVNPERFMNIANVANTDLKTFLNHPVLKEAYEEISHLPKICKKCCWEKVCMGGSDHSRYSLKKGFSNQSVMCAALKKTYGHISSYLIKNGYSIQKIKEVLFA